jgi:hypothetical protein
VSDESPPLVYDGLDPAPAPKSAFAEISDALNEAINRVSGAIEAGRKPGRPLSILSNVTREAPLGSLLVAFLLGVAVARRRSVRSDFRSKPQTIVNPRPVGRGSLAHFS